MSRFLDALKCKNRDRFPVWLMRQAGRCLPDYRALRMHHSLEELFHNPELAAQITAMPVQQLNVDAAIVFSDILMVAELFGFQVRFVEGKGPELTPLLAKPSDIEKLQTKEIATLNCVFDTIRKTREMLSVPVIGFCGGPFTVASYLIEGGAGSKELAKTKSWLFAHPREMHLLLTKITTASIEYLKEQVAAGAQALQIFDSWAHVLSTPFFMTFCLHYLKEMVHALESTGVPIILFCRGSSFFAQELITVGPSAISFDWHKELNALRKLVPPHIAVQGNFDPHLLKAPPATIRSEVQRVLHSMKGDPGYIVNLGHGVLPDTPLEGVKCFVDAVHECGV